MSNNMTKAQAMTKATRLVQRFGSTIVKGKRRHRIPSAVLGRQHKWVRAAIEELLDVPLTAPGAATTQAPPPPVNLGEVRETLQDVLQAVEVLQALRDLPERLEALEAAVQGMEHKQSAALDQLQAEWTELKAQAEPIAAALANN